MTHHIESLKLESEVLEQKNRHDSIVNYQMTISHEFRTPLASSLMFLESLLGEQMTTQARHLIKIIISQINLLLCLVNDILDLKLIEENKFVPKNEIFSPRDTFNFITSMFAPQVEMQNSTLSFKEVSILSKPSETEGDAVSSYLPHLKRFILPNQP